MTSTTTMMTSKVADISSEKVDWGIGEHEITCRASGTDWSRSQISTLRFLPRTKQGLEKAKSRNRARDLSRLKSTEVPSDGDLPSRLDIERLGPKEMAGFNYLFAAKRVVKKARNSLHEKKEAHNRKERELVLRMAMTMSTQGMKLTGKESWAKELFTATIFIQRWWKMRMKGKERELHTRRRIVGLEAEYYTGNNGSIVPLFSPDNEDCDNCEDSDNHYSKDSDDESDSDDETALLPAALSRWRALKKHTFELGGLPIRSSIVRACSRFGLLQDVFGQAPNATADTLKTSEESRDAEAVSSSTLATQPLGTQRRLTARANRINQHPENGSDVCKESESPVLRAPKEEIRHFPEVSARNFWVGGISRRELEPLSGDSIHSHRIVESESSGPAQSFRQRVTTRESLQIRTRRKNAAGHIHMYNKTDTTALSEDDMPEILESQSAIDVASFEKSKSSVSRAPICASQLRRDERANRAQNAGRMQDLCNPANLQESAKSCFATRGNSHQAYQSSPATFGSNCIGTTIMQMEGMHDLRAEASAPDSLYCMRAADQSFQELPQSSSIVDGGRRLFKDTSRLHEQPVNSLSIATSLAKHRSSILREGFLAPDSAICNRPSSRRQERMAGKGGVHWEDVLKGDSESLPPSGLESHEGQAINSGASGRVHRDPRRRKTIGNGIGASGLHTASETHNMHSRKTGAETRARGTAGAKRLPDRRKSVPAGIGAACASPAAHGQDLKRFPESPADYYYDGNLGLRIRVGGMPPSATGGLKPTLNSMSSMDRRRRIQHLTNPWTAKASRAMVLLAEPHNPDIAIAGSSPPFHPTQRFP